MDNIKIVRLQSGEDIIADYLEDTEGSTILLTNPMSLIFKRLPTGKAVMMMSPWLPLELVENTSARLFSQDVLTVFEPKAQLIEYYNTTVVEVEQDMYENEDGLDEMDDGEELTEEEEEEAYLELEQYQQDTKKRTLH
jgi:hypothetical protein|tara:strand:+ start:2389 stop:2802 length:414 start_codon:yes stop_codon:yes gene_type:complete